MSKKAPKEGNNFAEEDDRLFNGKPLSEMSPDDVVEVEGDAETGFEQVAEDPVTKTPEARAQTAEASDDDQDFTGLPPAAIKAMQSERKKRQAIQEQNQKLEAKLQQIEQQMQTQLQREVPEEELQIPNPATDPVGYHNYVMSVQQEGMENTRLNMSEAQARAQHGDQVVNEAFQALSQHPDAQNLFAQLRAKPHTWGELVVWHKRHQALSEIGDDPEAYKQKLREQILQELQGGASPLLGQKAPPPQTPNRPPRIGAAPSAMSPGAAKHTMEDAEANLWGR